MSNRVLVAYATSYGSTQEVAEVVAAALRGCGQAVDVKPAREIRTLDEYGSVVLGAPLIMYHWHKDARRFLARHQTTLKKLPVALFALGPIKEPHDDVEWQGARDQLGKELALFPWLTPAAVELFGGRFDMTRLGFPLKLFTGKVPPTDIRNWDAIRAWAESLPEKIG